MTRIMVLNNSDLSKVRMGLAKCPTCGRFYDPTTTGGPCPHCAKRYNLATIAFAVVVLLFLLFWLPLEATEAKAQEVPPTPEISATWWVPTPTPVVISPVAWCSVGPCVWLPVVAK